MFMICSMALKLKFLAIAAALSGLNAFADARTPAISFERFRKPHSDGVDGPTAASWCQNSGCRRPLIEEPSMLKVRTIGLDLAKHVFQVHGIDESGAVVIRRRLRRSDVMSFFARVEPTIVGMEACSTSHHWARELSTLGHQVRLMPAQYVKAYVKRQKNDAADAEAICEAVMRPSMRFVPIKTAEQQAALMLHPSRDPLVRQRTMLIKSLRRHLAEVGIIQARGPDKGVRLVALLEDAEAPVPALARQALRPLATQLEAVAVQIAAIQAAILAWHPEDET